MAEYIEREAFREVLKKSHEAHAKNSREEVLLDRDIRLLNEQPAADVVAVVRCRNCKHENVHRAISDKCTWCEYWGIDPDFDDFCSYGEKRVSHDG